MRLFLLISLFISSATFANTLPNLSYQCTSTATFTSDQVTVLKRDVQTVRAGYSFPVFTGLQEFHHSYENFKVTAAVQTGKGGDESSHALYEVLESESVPKALTSTAMFEAFGSSLPDSFSMSLKKISLAPEVFVLLKVVCRKE